MHLIEEGQPGIPTRNSRVMDELQQHGIVVPNEDRAIWLCDITIDDWRQSLTCLKIDLSRIWPDPDQRPSGTGVTVQPSTTKPTTDVNSDEEADQEHRPSAPDSQTPPVHANEPDLPLPPYPRPLAIRIAMTAKTSLTTWRCRYQWISTPTEAPAKG